MAETRKGARNYRYRHTTLDNGIKKAWCDDGENIPHVQLHVKKRGS